MTTTIASSAFSVDTPQQDTRVWVTNTHTLTDGTKRANGRLAAANEDNAAFLAADATRLAAALIADETAADVAAVQALGSLAVPTFIFCTPGQAFAALRAAYATATQLQAVMTADFLGSLTNAQLQAAFGMTAAQVTTLRSNKLTPATTLANSIRASVGQ